MKKREILALPVPKVRARSGWTVKATLAGETLVLDVFQGKEHFARHAVMTGSGEYATWFPKTGWTNQKVEAAIGCEEWEYGQLYYYNAGRKQKERWNLSKEDEKLIMSLFRPRWKESNSLSVISDKESHYGREKRMNAEERRLDRVNETMARIPAIPVGFKRWIDEKLCGCRDYAVKAEGGFSCSGCGEIFLPPKEARNHDEVECPWCGAKLILEKRKKDVTFIDHVCMIQPVCDEFSALREFWACVEIRPGSRKAVSAEENVRVLLKKSKSCAGATKTLMLGKPEEPCIIYWAQGWQRQVQEGEFVPDSFDYKSNPRNKRIGPSYTYDGGIREALEGTEYESCTRILELAAGMKADANRILYEGRKSEGFRDCMELLAKGRFKRLFYESSKDIVFWGTYGSVSGGYRGPLNLYGEDIGEVFRISDRQIINRIRDLNGGEGMLGWMQWSDENHEKVSTEFLRWAEQFDLEPEECRLTLQYLRPERMMHYITRQKAESYPTRNLRGVIGQYEDYMVMAAQLKKDLTDELVYRPRELRRRHDELVVEMELNRARLDAEAYRKRFPEAQKNIRKVAKKYEYQGEKFRIIVPREIVDVVAEGRALHHCAGSSDRYFDRMARNETYICFLRRNEAPDLPFYTIEVEPGGTIRQHRGLYDEEPEIEIVKPFLQEWQKVIRKRMKAEDHKLAAESKKKREENIRELKEKNNTRVLAGLMEDFMEAVNE